MSRYLLDTNIVSNITKAVPSEPLVAWFADQADQDLFIASLTLAEIWRGVLQKPAGRKRVQLKQWFEGPDGPPSLFSGRILPFDERAALVWGRLMSEGALMGRPRSSLDMIIAAVAEANACIVVTGNERDFAGLKFINPMD